MFNRNTHNEPRHTEEMQDIIGAPPSWLLRWGITMFFMMLLIIVGIAQIIQYPDIVKAQLKFKTFDLPQSVTAPATGKLFKLSVKNNQRVDSGQLLAVINTSAQTLFLKAKQSGIVTYADIIYEKQHLTIGQLVFNLNYNDQKFFGELTISQNSIGKVKDGQEVLIKLPNYPYQQYGILHGVIKYVVVTPARTGTYLAKVDLKANDTTDMNKTLLLNQDMLAEAEVITQNTSLLKRLTDNLFKNLNY